MLNMNAVRAYQQAEQEFLVDGSDPHRLVQILFTELLTSMDRTTHALEVNDLAAKSAASILSLSPAILAIFFCFGDSSASITFFTASATEPSSLFKFIVVLLSF